MIWYATSMLNADVVYSGILVMIIIYFILDKLLIQAIEKKTIARWGMITQKQNG